MALKLYSLGTGTLVAITGTWQAAPPQKEQPYELQAMDVKIIGAVDAEVGKITDLTRSICVVAFDFASRHRC